MHNLLIIWKKKKFTIFFNFFVFENFRIQIFSSKKLIFSSKLIFSETFSRFFFVLFRAVGASAASGGVCRRAKRAARRRPRCRSRRLRQQRVSIKENNICLLYKIQHFHIYKQTNAVTQMHDD